MAYKNLIKISFLLVTCSISLNAYSAYDRIIGPGNNGSKETVEPFEINGDQDVLIRNIKVSNPNGECIKIVNSARVKIVDSLIGPCGTYNSSNDQNRGFGIFVYNSDEITIQRNSLFDNFIGAVAISSTRVKINYNHLSGIGKHFIQFNDVNGAGNSISYNTISSSLMNHITEDMVNVFDSHGAANGKILVTHNRLKDGGRSVSGSGIMVGDNGGSNILVARNKLVDTGHVGIGVASGHDILVQDNEIYQQQLAIQDSAGMFVFEQYDKPCYNITLKRNTVDWTQDNGHRYAFYEDGTCQTQLIDNDFESLDSGLGTHTFWR